MAKFKAPRICTRNQPGEKPKEFRKTFKRLCFYLMKVKWTLFAVILTSIIGSFSGLIMMGMQKPLINNCLLPFIKVRNPDLTKFYNYIYIMVALLIIGIICAFLQAKLRIKVVTYVMAKIRTDMFAKIESLSLRFFDTHQNGEIMSFFTNDVDTLLALHALPQFILSVLTIFFVLTALIIMSPILTLAVVVILILMYLVIKVLSKLSRKFYKKQQENLSKVNGYVEEIAAGAKIVKVFCHEDEVKSEFTKKCEDLNNVAAKAVTCSNILMPIVGNLSYLLVIIIGLLGSYLLVIGKMDLGSLAVFIHFTRMLTRPIGMISMQYNEMLSALAGSERIFNFIDEPVVEDKGYVTLVNASTDNEGNIIEVKENNNQWAWKHCHSDGSITYTKLAGNIVFENVNFGYVPEKQVLFDFNLEAKAGSKIALVGPTGAGKTTITNLINKFYLLDDGKIRYDGINISKIKRKDLRKSMSMVLQDTHLFTASVKENIRYGNLDASDEDIKNVAKMACADTFIEKLPNGYDTILTSDGSNLSQGQKQLISIARAMLSNPPVLVLDEATSCVDTTTEKLIEKAMDNLMKGRTVFIIAHRLSTVRNADKIVVIEGGKIVEEGNHEELMMLRKKYYSLYTGAFELD
ncbi:MAG: ABC transporter ATP-binding protein/permease [Alphaproteobacteria bacterium]|nr:ABC transporter ATP-binding protein/permease [Alphaproteobacteria bacterium]